MLPLVKYLLHIKSVPQIIGFRGYGSQQEMKVIGRVTEKTGLKPSEQRLGAWQNAQALLKRYLASPLPNVPVTISWHDTHIEVTTNENGLFYGTLKTTQRGQQQEEAQWMTVHARLTEHTGEDTDTQLEILSKGQKNDYGIISDIDDTILISGATKKLTLLYKTFTQDSHVRKPFKGIVELLHALNRGKDGHSHNPIFYVSSSQWNLYDYLVEFMRINNFPKGVLLLKEIGNIRTLFKSMGNHSHKKENIREILNIYTALPFILIGDSGQHDAEIYSDIIREFPNRIQAVYIRDVTVKENTLVTKAVKAHNKHVPFTLIKTSQEAADHATELGLIPAKQGTQEIATSSQ